MHKNPFSDDNQRTFFALEDDIPLEVAPMLQGLHADPKTHLMEEPSVRLRSALYELDEEYYPYFSQIIRGNPYVAEYLHGLNKKLDLIMRHVLHIEPMPHQWVCISAGGIAFRSPELYDKDAFLLISMVLPTNQSFIVCHAQVTECVPLTDSPLFKTSTQFIDLNDRHEAAITRHIFQRELEAKRRAKGLED